MIRKTIFVTYPRSGHHWLMRCLQDYYGEEMVYCEHYTCCQTIPCAKQEANILKNHDFTLDLVIPEDWNVIVQYRNPQDAISSLYKVSKEKDYIKFIYDNLYWYYEWMRKWNKKKYFLVDYESRIANPIYTLNNVILNLSGESDLEKVKMVSYINNQIH